MIEILCFDDYYIFWTNSFGHTVNCEWALHIKKSTVHNNALRRFYHFGNIGVDHGMRIERIKSLTHVGF